MRGDLVQGDMRLLHPVAHIKGRVELDNIIIAGLILRQKHHRRDRVPVIQDIQITAHDRLHALIGPCHRGLETRKQIIAIGQGHCGHVMLLAQLV